MIDVGLIDRGLLQGLPAELADRLGRFEAQEPGHDPAPLLAALARAGALLPPDPEAEP